MARRNRKKKTEAKAAISPIPQDSPLNGLLDLADQKGIKWNGRSFEFPERALKDMIWQKMRLAGASDVPSLPKFQTADLGGGALSKSALSDTGRSFEDLRHARDDGPLIQALHSGITAKIRSFAKLWGGRRTDTGFRVVHKDHHRWDAEQPDYIQPYIRQFEGLLNRPSARPEYGCLTLSSFLAKLTDDLLTINQPAINLIYSTHDPRLLIGMRAVDGALIYRTMDYLQYWIRQNSYHQFGSSQTRDMDPDQLLDAISRLYDVNLTGDCPYVLVRDGIVERGYSSKEILIRPIETRTDVRVAAYPPGYLEMAMEAVSGFWTSWDFDMNRWSSDLWTDFFLFIQGGYQSKDVEIALQRLRQNKGYRGASEIPVVKGVDVEDIKRVDLKPVQDDLAFQKRFSFYASLVCAVYREHPSIINFPSWDGGKAATMSAPSQDLEIELSRSDGLRANLQHYADIFSEIAQNHCHPDLLVIPEIGDVDLKAEFDITERSVTKGVMTRNEGRLSQGLNPLCSSGFPSWISPDDRDNADEETLKRFYADPWNMPADKSYVEQLQISLAMFPLPGQQPMPQAQPGAPQPQPAAPQDPPLEALGKAPEVEPWRDNWL